jgi:hypothetical protein
MDGSGNEPLEEHLVHAQLEVPDQEHPAISLAQEPGVADEWAIVTRWRERQRRLVVDDSLLADPSS